MSWLLLNQLFVNMGYNVSGDFTIVEALSSELQLVQVLASATTSFKTMTSQARSPQWSNLELTENQGAL